MEKVSVDELESPERVEVDRRGLADPLGTTDVAINHYELAPGEAFSGGLHTHMDQEELFYVVEGTATFETMDGETEVGPREAVRFAPGEYQQGRNESEDRVVALALGAPKESTDVRVPMECRACGESDSLQFVMADGGAKLRCPECSEEFDADV